MNDPVRPEESWTEDNPLIPSTYAGVVRAAAELYAEMDWDDEADPTDVTLVYHRIMAAHLRALADLLGALDVDLTAYLNEGYSVGGIPGVVLLTAPLSDPLERMEKNAAMLGKVPVPQAEPQEPPSALQIAIWLFRAAVLETGKAGFPFSDSEQRALKELLSAAQPGKGV